VNKIRIYLVVFSLFIFSAGLAYYFTLYLQVPSFTILDHNYRFTPIPYFLSLIFIFFLFTTTWIFSARLEVKYFRVKLFSSLWQNFFSYLPFCLFLLTPFLLKHYLTLEDLKIRMNLLAVFILLSFLYLKLVHLNRYLEWKVLFEKGLKKFSSLSLKKKLFILFVVAFVLYNLCGFILVSKGLSFTGDEPYYLLTTHSLYKDQDINVANNYKNKDYSHFYPKELYPHVRLVAYARFGRKGTDYVYPINQPGISVLILPYYWLSQFFKGKILVFILKVSLSIWAVFLGLQLYLLSKELWKNEMLSLVLWFFYSFTSPIIFYAVHLYPEIPIALFSIYIFRKVRSKKALSLFHYFFLGFILSLFIWFGLKYNMIFWPLLIVSVYFLLKEHKARWRILCFLSLPILSLVLFYYYLYELYGSFYPIAIYEGVITPEIISAFKEAAFKTPVLLRIDTFLDYFLDQRDGLLLYSPIYFFAFLGLVEIFRRAKKDLLVLFFIFLPFLLNYAFFTHRQGGCPQGRVLTPISWIGAVFIGYFIAYNSKKFYSFLFWFLSLISLVAVIILIQHPHFLYQPTTHEYTFRGGEFFIFFSNLHFYLPSLLPSFIKVNNVGYLPNYVWLGLILLFMLGYLLKKENPRATKFFVHILFTLIGLFVLFAWFALYPRLVLLFPTRAVYPNGAKIGFYSLSRRAQMREPGEFYLSQENRFYSFHFTSRRKIEKIKIEFGSLEGENQIEIRLFDIVLFKGKTSREINSLVYPSPPLYRLKNTNLYSLHLDLKKVSDVSTTEIPFFFSIFPLK